MSEEKKIYTVQGHVDTVYNPQTIPCERGGKKFTSEKTDVILRTPKGGKVRVSFWNQEVSKSIEGADVSITNLAYKGVYREVNQFSSTKESKIHVLNGSTANPVKATAVEVDPTDPGPGVPAVSEPAVSEPEQDADPSDPPATPAVQAVQTAMKKRGRPAKVTPDPTPAATPYAPERLTGSTPEHPSEALVLSNLQAAERISKALGYDRLSIAELIQLSDQVGRTAVALRIEQGKNGRMDRFQK